MFGQQSHAQLMPCPVGIPVRNVDLDPSDVGLFSVFTPPLATGKSELKYST